ncbi:hypothetical protein D9C73_022584 [Collichthys lucidus]|uniref:Uncharacterized protein n=1 Tax=Collichthys lucidus TaxID=240159 RepID=A0A4U5VP98_COLLU|nr:hypothetical protein D9C73_022584 [Collichthys lucidus]
MSSKVAVRGSEVHEAPLNRPLLRQGFDTEKAKLRFKPSTGSLPVSIIMTGCSECRQVLKLSRFKRCCYATGSYRSRPCSLVAVDGQQEAEMKTFTDGRCSVRRCQPTLTMGGWSLTMTESHAACYPKDRSLFVALGSPSACKKIGWSLTVVAPSAISSHSTVLQLLCLMAQSEVIHLPQMF